MHDTLSQHQMRRTREIRRSSHPNLRYIRCNIVELKQPERKSCR
jgi:hypothetical protein